MTADFGLVPDGFVEVVEKEERAAAVCTCGGFLLQTAEKVLNLLDARWPLLARSDVECGENFDLKHGLRFSPASSSIQAGSIARGARASIRSTPGHISGE
jgi:hypothetical protein